MNGQNLFIFSALIIIANSASATSVEEALVALKRTAKRPDTVTIVGEPLKTKDSTICGRWTYKDTFGITVPAKDFVYRNGLILDESIDGNPYCTDLTNKDEARSTKRNLDELGNAFIRKATKLYFCQQSAYYCDSPDEFIGERGKLAAELADLRTAYGVEVERFKATSGKDFIPKPLPAIEELNSNQITKIAEELKLFSDVTTSSRKYVQYEKQTSFIRSQNRAIDLPANRFDFNWRTKGISIEVEYKTHAVSGYAFRSECAATIRVNTYGSTSYQNKTIRLKIELFNSDGSLIGLNDFRLNGGKSGIVKYGPDSDLQLNGLSNKKWSECPSDIGKATAVLQIS